MNSLPVLELREVSRAFLSGSTTVQALNAASLLLKAGELVSLCGPSGSGKSTLLNIAGLTDRPDSGQVILDSISVDFSNSAAVTRLRRSQIGFVFQYFNLLSHLSARENISMTLLLNGSSWAEASARAESLLHDVGLSHRAEHRPHMLSGGEMQRVAIARALAHRPKLILADEPTGNLDSASGDTVLDLLCSAAGQGAAVLMATHSERAAGRCHRTLHVNDGTLSSR